MNKSFAVISAERKYFSGASGIKISDKIQPSPRLREPVVRAVAHIPFKTIPQLMKRGEDFRKRCPLVMDQQARNVFKQQIRRLSCFSQPGNLKEESSSGVIEPKSMTCG